MSEDHVNLSVDANARRARRMAWVALIAAMISLIFVVVSQSLGGRVPWTSWGLSFVLAANSVVFLLSQARQHPRFTTVFYRLSAVASLVILSAIVVQFWHRYLAS